MLAEARRRINESFEPEKVLKGVTDSARALTEARYGIIVLHDSRDWIVDYFTSGLSSRQTEQVWKLQGVLNYHHHFSERDEFMRVADFQRYTVQHGLPEFRPPFAIADPMPFLWASIRHQEKLLGVILLLDKEPGIGTEFTRDDQEVMEVFAAQAALAISNSYRHQDLQAALEDYRHAIDLAPIGTLVFDASTEQLKSANRVAHKLLGNRLHAECSLYDLKACITPRSGDGLPDPIDLREFSQALNNGRMAWREEVVVDDGDGGTAVCAMSTLQLRSAEHVDSVVVTLQDLKALERVDQTHTERLRRVSDELRQPLSHIMGAVATLQECMHILDTSEAAQYLEIISEQSTHIRRQLADLNNADRARPESRLLPPRSLDA